MNPQDLSAPAAIVLPTGPHKGYSLAEAFAADPDYVRRLAWAAGPRDPIDDYVRSQAAAYLQTLGEQPLPPLPPDTSPQGQRLYSLTGEGVTLFVDLDDNGARFLMATDSEVVAHHLPDLDARVLAVDLVAGRLSDNFYHYGGQTTTCTSLSVQDKGESFRYPVRLEVRQGAGVATADGIRPDDHPRSLTLQISRYEARKLGLTLSDHLLARSIRFLTNL